MRLSQPKRRKKKCWSGNNIYIYYIYWEYIDIRSIDILGMEQPPFQATVGVDRVDLFHFGILHSQLHWCHWGHLPTPGSPEFGLLRNHRSQGCGRSDFSAIRNHQVLADRHETPLWNPTSLCLSHENSWVNDLIQVNDYSNWLMKSH